MKCEGISPPPSPVLTVLVNNPPPPSPLNLTPGVLGLEIPVTSNLNMLIITAAHPLQTLLRNYLLVFLCSVNWK